jgi:BRCT domain type II-containing protein
VAGDNVGATKVSKARSLGTGVLDEAGLSALLSGSHPSGSEPVVASKPADPEASPPYRQQELF